MQPYQRDLASTKLTPHTNDIIAGPRSYRADVIKGVVVERSKDNQTEYPIAQVTGGKNVYYFLTQLERGWLQVLPVAYDVRKKEWFDTTLSAMRHFGTGTDEPLYWKDRPLTFNTSCFNCHVSQIQKRYDVATDSYNTTWSEPGIHCDACHGPTAAHVELFKRSPKGKSAPADLKVISTKKLSPAQRNDLCAQCHAKMSPITERFTPGDRFWDHFDLVALENPDFYPDGRDLGENYTWTQWLQNPCARSGKLECLHCHTSSGRYRFVEPAKANDACLPCHKERVGNAEEHTRHKPGSPGNQCVACHMPKTEFARMTRSDHSMRPPTPAASVAWNSPNACAICHTNTAQWADEKVRQWRKRDYQKLVLERANWIAAARKRDWSRLREMLASFTRHADDEVYVASLARLLADCPDSARLAPLRNLATHQSPLVRAAACEALSEDHEPETLEVLAKASQDEFRLVRIRAASALAATPPAAVPERFRESLRKATAEYVASLAARPDDMASHYNAGNFHMARGEMPAAVAAYETALRLQPDALQPRVNAALAYNALGENAKAETSLRTALRQHPTNAPAHLNLGMLLAELDRLPEAEASFRQALKHDPNSAQAAYNLGLCLMKSDLASAMTFLQRAASLRPEEPRYAFSLAFAQRQQGKAAAAILTLERCLQDAPAHADAYALLAQIYAAEGRTKDAVGVCNRALSNDRLSGEEKEAFASLLQKIREK